MINDAVRASTSAEVTGPNRFQWAKSELSPDHLIHHPRIGLDNLHDLGRDVFVDVVRHQDAVVAGSVHGDSAVHDLKEALFVEAGKDEG